MKTHTIAGGGSLKLHVRQWGDPSSPAILLIHGWSQSHLCWEQQYQNKLLQDFHLVALDLRGHGMSEAPLDPACYADSKLWADDIAAIIHQLNLDHPILVGWSYGGLVIGDYLRIHGHDAIGGINYVGAASVLNESAFGSLIGPGFLDNFAEATSADLPTNIAAMNRFLHACFEIPLSRPDFERALAYNMMVSPTVRLNLGSRDLDNTDVLDKLDIPVLVSQGKKDIVVLPSSAETILKHCRTAIASWYDSVGHAPFLEDATRFNRELAEFTLRVRTQ
ncbi:MAG: non-heme chloroperoxidase [Gammaproteobacteria bacterium]|jgi:non-heme chloroperoxidase